MKVISLALSEEDYDRFLQRVALDDKDKNFGVIEVKEVLIRESPKLELLSVRGELR